MLPHICIFHCQKVNDFSLLLGLKQDHHMRE